MNRAYQSVCEFPLADFPLMNLNDLITLAYLIKSIEDKLVIDKNKFCVGMSICQELHRLLFSTPWFIRLRDSQEIQQASEESKDYN